jgi:archaellum component FlaF (FlaF/FlaG flagellin family)
MGIERKNIQVSNSNTKDPNRNAELLQIKLESIKYWSNLRSNKFDVNVFKNENDINGHEEIGNV